jgi:DNA-binding transcriptional regulator YiaG
MTKDEVKTARETLGISQAELARRIGVSRRTVEGWEQDRREPTADSVAKIEALLKAAK